MGVKTSTLKYNTMKMFKDNISSNTCFIFASTLLDIDVTVNSDRSQRLFLEKTIFGKKILDTDVRFMIKNNLWVSGSIYDEYSDSLDITNLNYYVISAPTGGSGVYSIFKCLNNNYNSVSLDRPVFNDNLSIQNYILNTADGYKWKYMYSVNATDVEKYSSNGLFPIINDITVQSSSVKSIDKITVTNPADNYGYDTISGTVSSIASSSTGGLRTISITAKNFNSITDYYINFCFYTKSSNGVTAKKYIIGASGLGPKGFPYIKVRGYIDGDISNLQNETWSFDILPQVEIIGDGSGADAISVVANSRITDIIILDGGVNYTRAIAKIVAPTFGFNPTDPNSSDKTCVLDVILPPRTNNTFGAHGVLPELELSSSNLLITSLFLSADTPPIPNTNTYSKVGLVKEPVFSTSTPVAFDNRIRIEVASVTGLNQNDLINQTETNFFAKIHELDSINNYIYVTEYYGPYSDQSETAAFYLSNITPLNNTLPIETPVGRIDVIGVTYPTYINGSGDVLYIKDFYQIARTSDLSEQFKFILEF